MIVSAKTMHHEDYRKLTVKSAIAKALEFVDGKSWTKIEKVEDADGNQVDWPKVRMYINQTKRDRVFTTRIVNNALMIREC